MNKKTDERIEKLEKELEEKNKQLLSLERLKSEFVSTVSHELRTPMVITRESVNQVHDGFLGDVNAEQKQFLSIAMEGIDRLGRIVDDLLDFSKLDAGKSELGREPANIVTVAKNVLNSYQKQAEEKGLALKFTSERYFVEANVDRDRMAHVFTNLRW
jgi:signal transduction histidine kinase